MEKLEQIRRLYDKLDIPDRYQFLFESWVRESREPHPFLMRQAARDFPSIVKTPGVCGGAACLIRTRIPVWTLERMRQLGIPEHEILGAFPRLSAIDLVQAWEYVERNRAMIDEEIRENEADAEVRSEKATAPHGTEMGRSRRGKRAQKRV
jgi:uncharacterized protein (DUF433 family)